MKVRRLVVVSAFALTGCFLNPIGEDPGATETDQASGFPPGVVGSSTPDSTGAPIFGDDPTSGVPPSGPAGMPGNIDQPPGASVPVSPGQASSPTPEPVVTPALPGAGGSGAATGGSSAGGGVNPVAGGSPPMGGASAAGGAATGGSAEPGPGDSDAGTTAPYDGDAGPPGILGGAAGSDAGAP